MKYATLGLIFFTYGLAAVHSYVPRMIRGRPKGGFVGSPGTKHLKGSLKVKAPPDQWYVQKLNHFDGADNKYWKQRYFTNSTFYKPGGPLFVQIGGEGTADPIWLIEGAWMQYAKKYNAYCVLLEHRFYGKSHPTHDMSDENLVYLSSEQALADLAAFVSELKANLSNPKVITFGGSYPGALSAWFRLKYPHLVDGAVASSAPLLARVNFKEYLEVVNSALKTFDGTGSCNKAVQAATLELQEKLKTSDGRKKLKSMFKLCDTIDPNIKTDIANLVSTLAGNFEGVVQYNKDNRAFEGVKGTNITVDTLCSLMNKTSAGDPLARYAMVNALLMDVYSLKCQDFKYDKMIKDMKQVTWESSAAEGGRQWTYQTCTEFAFYQSSDSQNQPFGHGFSIDFWITQCQDIFGKVFNKTLIDAAVKRSNVDYGALGIKTSKVVFPNGSIDPWHALGVLADLSPDVKAIYINGTAHCANMYPPSPDDLPQLTKARADIQSLIGMWIST